MGSDATYEKLINLFEQADHKDYADNVRQILPAEGISSCTVDSSTTHLQKTSPELKPEFPSVESVTLLSSVTTSTTVVIEKEHRQGIIKF